MKGGPDKVEGSPSAMEKDLNAEEMQSAKSKEQEQAEQQIANATVELVQPAKNQQVPDPKVADEENPQGQLVNVANSHQATNPTGKDEENSQKILHVVTCVPNAQGKLIKLAHYKQAPNPDVTEKPNTQKMVDVLEEAEPKQVLIPVLMSEPVQVAGIVQLHNCANYQHLAAEINRVYSEVFGIPRNENPSMDDPMPGFNLTYLPPSPDEPNLDPAIEYWEAFSAVLDLIVAVPK